MSLSRSHGPIFVDTSAYYSAKTLHDANHRNAQAILIDLITNRRQLITTNLILAELHALILTRMNRTIAIRVLQEIDASQLTTVVRVSEEDKSGRGRSLSNTSTRISR